MKNTPAPDATDLLIAQADKLEADSASTGIENGQDQDGQDQNLMLAKIEAGAAKVVLVAFKLLRAWAVKRLPELKEEWPDELLKEPVENALPILKKYVSSLMEKVGENAELAAFCLSLVPLAMGYISAQEKHDVKAAKDLAIAKSELIQA